LPELEEDTAKPAKCRQKHKSIKLKALKPNNTKAQISNAFKVASALVMQASKTQIAEDKIILKL